MKSIKDYASTVSLFLFAVLVTVAAMLAAFIFLAVKMGRMIADCVEGAFRWLEMRIERVLIASDKFMHKTGEILSR